MTSFVRVDAGKFIVKVTWKLTRSSPDVILCLIALTEAQNFSGLTLDGKMYQFADVVP
jgi:hypothetical protein